MLNPDYASNQCPQIEAFDRDAVDSAKLKRDLAYGGIGLGVVVAGVGTYLLVTGRRAPESAAVGLSASSIGAWSDGQSSGMILSGWF
jgi:hypothetical protein